MKLSDVQNLAMFFSIDGNTLALKMTAEQKRIIALFALSTVGESAKMVVVPHMTLPADPTMQEAAQ